MKTLKVRFTKSYANLRDNSIIVKKLRKRYMSKLQSEYKMPSENISVIASNCIGGEIYHDLGMPFQSPTINLWMTQKHFMKLISDMSYYFEQQLRFVHDEGYSCPTAYLGIDDRRIKLIFLHYKTDFEAQSKWEERKHRVDFNNLYFVMSDRDGITYDDIVEFGKIPCKGRIIFTYKDYPEIPYAFKLGNYKNENNVGHYQKKTWSGFYGFEKQFNSAKWLSGDNDCRINKFIQYLFF